jgi:hypothetical protein
MCVMLHVCVSKRENIDSLGTELGRFTLLFPFSSLLLLPWILQGPVLYSPPMTVTVPFSMVGVTGCSPCLSVVVVLVAAVDYSVVDGPTKIVGTLLCLPRMSRAVSKNHGGSLQVIAAAYP